MNSDELVHPSHLKQWHLEVICLVWHTPTHNLAYEVYFERYADRDSEPFMEMVQHMNTQFALYAVKGKI